MNFLLPMLNSLILKTDVFDLPNVFSLKSTRGNIGFLFWVLFLVLSSNSMKASLGCPPVLSISSSSPSSLSICQDSTILIWVEGLDSIGTDSVGYHFDNGQIQWITNTSINTNPDQDTLVISHLLSPGVHVFYLDSIAGCTGVAWGPRDSIVIIILASPTISNMTETVCSGLAFTSTPADGVNGIVPAGTTYSWSAPTVTGGMTGGASGNGATSISGNLSNPTNSPQTATYSVTPTSGTCGGTPFTITVSVNPKPSISNMTETVCSGLAFSSIPANGVNGIVPSGTTYSWSAPTVTGGMTGGASGSSASSISGNLTNPTNSPQTATYTITPTAGTCTGSAFTVTVTVDRLPSITNMSSSTCSGQAFSVQPVNGTNGVVPTNSLYSWSTPSVTGGLTGGSSASGAAIISGNLNNPTISTQTATYTISPTAGACSGASFTLAIAVNPAASVSSISETICSGASFNSIPANGLNGLVPAGTTYSWPTPSVTGGITGGASGSASSSISGTLSNPTNSTQTATYTVTPNSGTCGGTPFNITVTVNPKPSISNMTETVCSGLAFTSTPANGVNGIVPAGTIYSWSAPTVTGGLMGGASGSGASTISGNLSNPTNSPQTATYTVTPTTGTCSGTSFTVTVTVNPKPSISNMTETVCSGSSFTSLPSNGVNGIVPSGTTYVWLTPSVTGGLTGGSSGLGASNIFGTLSNPTNSPQTATYSVTPTSGTCSGALFTVTVTVNPRPAISNLNLSICSETGFSFTPSNGTNGIVPTGTSYTWPTPNVTGSILGGVAGSGSSISNGSLTNQSNIPQVATYVVTPTAGSCIGSPFNFEITVNPKPAVNTMVANACSGQNFQVIPANITNGIVPAGTTYSWPSPSTSGNVSGGSGGSALSQIGGNLSLSTLNPGTATYSILPNFGTCFGDTFSLTINVAATPVITTLADTICSGQGFSLTPFNGPNGIVPNGTNYAWPNPSVTGNLIGAASGNGSFIFSSGLNNPTNSNQFATYTVTPTAAACTGAPFSLTVTVKPTPAISNVSISSCEGQSFSYSPTNGLDSIVPNGTNYSWPLPVVSNGLIGGVIGTNDATIFGLLSNPSVNVQAAIYTITPLAGQCSGSDFTITVSINPTPRVNPMADTICSNESFALSPLNGVNGTVPGGTIYDWSIPTFTGGLTGGSSGSGESNISDTLYNLTNSEQLATYLVSPSTGSCTGDSFAVFVTINPRPEGVNLVGETVVCGNQVNALYTIDSIRPGIGFDWTCTNGTVVGSSSSPSAYINWGSGPANGQLVIQQTYISTGCSSNDTLAVSISSNSAPAPTNILRIGNSNILVCDDSSACVEYQWGYIERATMINTPITPGGNLRYVLLPHTYDSLTYIYYVETSCGGCRTTSYMDYNPAVEVTEEMHNEIILFPNPTREKVFIEGLNFAKMEFHLMDPLGKEVKCLVNRVEGSISFPAGLPDGIYYLSISSQRNRFIKKILIAQ